MEWIKIMLKDYSPYIAIPAIALYVMIIKWSAKIKIQEAKCDSRLNRHKDKLERYKERIDDHENRIRTNEKTIYSLLEKDDKGRQNEN